jgi:integrase
MPQNDIEAPKGQTKKNRRPPRRTTFTELSLARQRPPKVGQKLYWDTGSKGQLGLSVLMSAGGTKTFRATFQLHGEPISAKLGRVGEMDLGTARERTREYRKLAASGIDPRKPKHQVNQEGNATLFETVVDKFIEEYAKPQQRTWDQTARILKNCTPLLKTPMVTITKDQVRDMLRGYIAAGKPYKAAITRAWLRKLWRWRAEEEEDFASNAMQFSIKIEKRERDRVYSDAEISATWNAANQLDPIESAFIKLLMLLAPRKTALACMRRSHLDDADHPTLWTTPFELTRSRKTSSKKRVYLTPLPALAVRIIKGLPKGVDDRMFPGLRVHETEAGALIFEGIPLKCRLIEHGAPADFGYHTWRHTIATFLENAGYPEWERGLVLNHSGSGSVTAGYSHGHPLQLKRKLLEEWADHIEGLVQPKGAKLLR